MTYTEFLLEEIAANTRSMLVEKKAYLESLRQTYASGKQSTTEVHGGVRTQPEAHGRQMPVQEGRVGVQQHVNQKPSGAQKPKA